MCTKNSENIKNCILLKKFYAILFFQAICELTSFASTTSRFLRASRSSTARSAAAPSGSWAASTRTSQSFTCRLNQGLNWTRKTFRFGQNLIFTSCVIFLSPGQNIFTNTIPLFFSVIRYFYLLISFVKNWP